MARPKLDRLLERIKECLDADKYYDTSHATLRKSQRRVSLPHILHVLRTGYHEKKKDEYRSEYGDWNYAIRGKDIENRDLRIVVAFDENDMLIITVIVLADTGR